MRTAFARLLFLSCFLAFLIRLFAVGAIGRGVGVGRWWRRVLVAEHPIDFLGAEAAELRGVGHVENVLGTAPRLGVGSLGIVVEHLVHHVVARLVPSLRVAAGHAPQVAHRAVHDLMAKDIAQLGVGEGVGVGAIVEDALPVGLEGRHLVAFDHRQPDDEAAEERRIEDEAHAGSLKAWVGG